MRSVTYSMGVSLDGYIAGPDGDITAPPPDEEVFRFVTDEIRQVGVHLLGRGLYETMLYWETADQDPSLDDSELEWAAIWKPLAKVVFSTTLPAVQGNARLASGGLAEEIGRLRAEPGEGDIAIGGATLAAEAAALGLIDEYRARVYPVLVGGGIRSFPSASAGWISNSSRPAPSARKSSTSATAWRVSRRPPSPGMNGPAGGLTSITQLSSRSGRSSDLGSSATFTARSAGRRALVADWSRTLGPPPARSSRGGHRRRTSPDHPESAPRRRSTSRHDEIRSAYQRSPATGQTLPVTALAASLTSTHAAHQPISRSDGGRASSRSYASPSARSTSDHRNIHSRSLYGPRSTAISSARLASPSCSRQYHGPLNTTVPSSFHHHSASTER